jgi:sugar phosphate isomerase/epimerase
MHLNAQLYSVKEECEVDFIGTLKAIKAMGYSGVEFAGYYGVEPKDLKKTLDDLGLLALSAHVSLDRLKNNLEEEINTLLTLGAKYIVCPYSEIKTLEDTLKLADDLTRIGHICKDKGLTLLYHNHAHEFVIENNQYLLEAFYNAVDADVVLQEVDIYWVAYAGIDVYDYLEKYGHRNKLIHLKQIENMDSKNNVEASKGILDFKKVIEMVPTAQFIYEQEKFLGDRLEEMARSFDSITNK